MSKLTKRKTIVEVGKLCPTNYEINKSNREKAIELSKTDLPHLKNKPIKYDLKR